MAEAARGLFRVGGRVFEVVDPREHQRGGELNTSPRAKGQRVQFAEQTAAQRWLAPFAAAPGGMALLRRRLARTLGGTAVVRLDDNEVVRELASRLAASHLRVYAVAEPRRVYPFVPGEEELDTAPLTAEPEEDYTPWVDAEREVVSYSPFAEAEPANDPLTPWADAEDRPPPAPPAPPELADDDEQVQVLKDAADEGAPFCEECEAARLARLAGAAPPAATAPPAAAAPPPAADPAAVDHVDPVAQAATLTQASDSGVPFCEECERAKKAQAAAAAGGAAGAS